MLVATWAVGLIGVAVALGRGGPGLPDLLIICAGVTTGFCTTAVAAAGLPLWQDAFGRSATDGSWAGRWWAYGPAMAVLAVGLAGQVGLGRAIRSVGTPEKSVVPLTRLPADRSIGRLGVLMLGSLTAGAVGTAAGVAAAAWAGQLVLPPSLFIVPVAAGSYVVSRAGCTRLAADPPRRVDQRNPVRYAWVAGWTATLTLALALLPLALTPLLPQLDSAGLTVALAVCTVIGGIVGQLPIDRAFRWTRRRTGPALAQHAAILAAQLASAAAGLVVALVILAQLERFDATPQGVAVAVLVAGFGIAVVDLARTRPHGELRFRAGRRRSGDVRGVLAAGRDREPVRVGTVDVAAGHLVRRGPGGRGCRCCVPRPVRRRAHPEHQRPTGQPCLQRPGVRGNGGRRRLRHPGAHGLTRPPVGVDPVTVRIKVGGCEQARDAHPDPVAWQSCPAPRPASG